MQGIAPLLPLRARAAGQGGAQPGVALGVVDARGNSIRRCAEGVARLCVRLCRDGAITTSQVQENEQQG